ncbi:hypothetical protein [Nocardioides sp. KR10-350]|uniref:hypothetical protein n=1 Tax=Nocardioides cheoyonin TaxID=3156615 RepID=UPI0032B5E1CE
MSPFISIRNPRRDERGSMVINQLIGMVVGTIIIGGFLTFYLNASASGNDINARNFSSSQTLLVVDQVASDASKATDGITDSSTTARPSRRARRSSTTPLAAARGSAGRFPPTAT